MATSYHDLEPLELGGEIARKGFHFQDHVAAKYCINMVSDPQLTAVWCETLDDITLVWSKAGTERFEFVQAKSNELDQLWSTKLLCQRPPGKTSKSRRDSIVQKSLGHDRGAEPCCFRIVTAREFKKELTCLTKELGSPGRKSGVQLTKLALNFEKSHRVKPAPSSPNGNDLAFWLERTVLDVAGDMGSLSARNKLALQTAVAKFGITLTGSQLDAVYNKLLARVNEAGRAPWSVDPDEKKFSRSDMIASLKVDATHAGMPPMSAGTKLRKKMGAAKMPSSDIEAALDLRRRHRLRSLDAGYLDASDRDKLETATISLLSGLRSELLADSTIPEGAKFLARCRNELTTLATTNGVIDHVLEAYLVGFMYEVTDRCQHTFVRK